MRFWELVNAYVRKEPMANRDRFFYAWLKDLGIEKGKPFKPTASQKKILEDVGRGHGHVAGNLLRQDPTHVPDLSLWQGSRLGRRDGRHRPEKMNLPTYSEFDQRASYGFEATTTSAGMVSRVPGKGSAYLGSYYDADGKALMGGKNYRLRISPTRAANFWSVAVLGIENHLIIRNEIKRSDRSSRTEGLLTNPDGSVDLYQNPEEQQKGKEVNWMPTNPGRIPSLYLENIQTEQAYFDQSWSMNKIQKMK